MLQAPILSAALFFLFIGIKLVIGKRAIVLSPQIFLLFLLGAFSPLIKGGGALLMDGTVVGGAVVLSIVLGVFVVVWAELRDCVFFIGVKKRAFLEALKYSLKKEGLEFQKGFSEIEIPSEQAKLRVYTQSWQGTAQLKLKSAKRPDFLKVLIRNINDYNQANNITARLWRSISYILIGVALFVWQLIVHLHKG